MSVIFTNKLLELRTSINIFESLKELVSETLNPLDVLILDFDKSVTDMFLPLCNCVNIWSVLADGLRCETFYAFKLLKLILIFLVNVMEIFLGNDTP